MSPTSVRNFGKRWNSVRGTGAEDMRVSWVGKGVAEIEDGTRDLG
jgi:hypothetical protein